MDVRKVSVGLSLGTNFKNRFGFESFPFILVMTRNVVSFSEISAVNLIVEWKLIACSMNRF